MPCFPLVQNVGSSGVSSCGLGEVAFWHDIEGYDRQVGFEAIPRNSSSGVIARPRKEVWQSLKVDKAQRLVVAHLDDTAEPGIDLIK